MPKKKAWRRKSLSSNQSRSQRSQSVGSQSVGGTREVKLEDDQIALSGLDNEDEGLFELSDSPHEDFGDNAAESEWPVEQIVRFEVDYKGRTK